MASLEADDILRRPLVPLKCEHNAHMYYILLACPKQRSEFIEKLKQKGIHALFHYVPLHSSPAGLQFGRVSGEMVNTDELAGRVTRLPLWINDDMAELLNSIHVIERELRGLQ